MFPPRVSRLGDPLFAASLLALLLLPAARSARPSATDIQHVSLASPLVGSVDFGSSFGEFRYNHLHAGVDLSTGGRTGLPVRAAADGEVYRIKREWRGYGLALYIRHSGMGGAGGGGAKGSDTAGSSVRVTVYAHLDHLQEGRLRLASRYKDLLERSGSRYPGDLFLDPPVRVRRGEVIAFSGETGVGLPHLHFELRDGESVPIDPVLAGLPWSDARPPVLEQLILRPAGPWHLPESGSRLEVPLDGRPAGAGAAPPSAVVRGRFRASVACFDPTPGGRAGVPSLTFLLDGQPAYALDLTRLPFDLYTRVGEVLDMGESRLSPARFVYRLSRSRGNPFASSGLDALEPTDGDHRLTVIARDRGGNSRSAEVALIVSRARLRIIDTEPGEADRLHLRWSVDNPAGAPDNYLPEAELSRNLGKTWAPLPCHVAGDRLLVDVPLPREGTIGLRMRARRGAEVTPWSTLLARFVARGGWQFLHEGGPDAWPGGAKEEGPKLHWTGRVEVRDDSVVVTVELDRLVPLAPLATLRLPGEADVTMPLLYEEGRSYQGAFPLPADSGVGEIGVRFVAEDGEAAAGTLPLGLSLALPGRRTEVRRDELLLAIPENAVLEPVAVTLEKVQRPFAPALASRSSAFRIGPADAALDLPALVQFEAPPDRCARCGVYRLDEDSRRWLFADRVVEGPRIGASVRRLGTYALLEDNSPPLITRTFPRDRAVVPARRGLVLEAHVSEEGEGLGPDGVSFAIDGRAVPSEYDPDEGLSRSDPVSLSRGPHRVTITASDLAGNRSSPVILSFVVR